MLASRAQVRHLPFLLYSFTATENEVNDYREYVDGQRRDKRTSVIVLSEAHSTMWRNVFNHDNHVLFVTGLKQGRPSNTTTTCLLSYTLLAFSE